MYEFKELSLDQRRIFIDAVQAFQAFRDADEKRRSYAGGMHWKTVANREYLIRTRGGHGRQQSLGPRSPETEKEYQAFQQHKEEAGQRYEETKGALQYQSRLARAAYLGRVPSTVADIARFIMGSTRRQRHIQIIGTNALYAYEAAAGVHLDTELVATRDADLLWDNRNGLKLTGTAPNSLLGLLRKADRSFEVLDSQPFRAVNKDGFMVDLVSPVPSPPHKETQSTMGSDPEDLSRVEVPGLAWLVSSPRMAQVAIDERGFPVEFLVPDPRVFALHKAWLAEQPDREPVKKGRDKAQADAVVALIQRYLPSYQFREQELAMLPASMRSPGPEAAPLPPGLEADPEDDEREPDSPDP